MSGEYYDRVWTEKLSLPQYQTLDKRWRSRWDYAVERIPERSRVLDVACGDGVLGEMLIRTKSCEEPVQLIQRVEGDGADQIARSELLEDGERGPLRVLHQIGRASCRERV